MSLLDKIFKLGEAPEAKVNEEGFYAIGKHKISGEKVKEWSDMLRAGVCPPELSVCEFYEWRDNIRVTSDIPKRPLNDTHTIEYEAIPIARFEDDKWQLYTPSLIEGVPPITAAEIPSIYGKRTITIEEKMQDLAEEMDSLDALIDEQESDVKTSDLDDKDEHGEEI